MAAALGTHPARIKSRGARLPPPSASLFALLLALFALVMPASAGTTTAQPPAMPLELISVPSISTTDNGNITLNVARGSLVQIQLVDSDTSLRAGDPVPVATRSDLSTLSASLSQQVELVSQQFSSAVAGLQLSLGSVSGALASSAVAWAKDLSAATASLEQQVRSGNVDVQEKINATTANLQQQINNNNNNLNSAINTNAQAILDVQSALTGLVGTTVSTAVASLQPQIDGKVDRGNLAVIDGQIQQVVGSLVTGTPASNALFVQLGNKLATSPTCQCFNPATFNALASTVSSLVNTTNATLSCTNQGLVYNPASNSCINTAPPVDCGSRITTLPAQATAICGLTPGSTRQGATCVATCNTGYNGGAAATYVCNSSGLWSGSLSCPADACPALSAPINGIVSPASGVTGTVATYTCNSGFYASSATSTQCQTTGFWSNPPPVCFPLCPTLVAPVNGTVALPSQLVFGRTATYACRTGFVLNGISTSTCLESGQWSTPAPVCDAVCVVTAPGNGTVIAPNTLIKGSSVIFNCNQGYTVTGSRTSVCNSDGSWSDPFPTCRANFCLSPMSAPGNGTVNGGTVATSATTLASVIFFCNQGYTNLGASSSQCLPSGLWSNPTPICEANACPNLSNPANGAVSRTSGVTGDVAVYSCIANFATFNGTIATCLTTGAWSIAQPMCTAAVCPSTPPAVTNGAVDSACAGNAFGSICQPICNAGFAAASGAVCVPGIPGQWSTNASCAPIGGRLFTTVQSTTFIVPANVFFVHVVVVGAGGGGASTGFANQAGGGGGALAWANNIAVTPGQSIPIVVGGGRGPGTGLLGGLSSFNGNIIAFGGSSPAINGNVGGAGGTRSGGGGGGNGGAGGVFSGSGSPYGAGGGGAGGYAGNGGVGGNSNGYFVTAPVAGSGTGGAGGGGGGAGDTANVGSGGGSGGGGVGVYGQGPISGAGGTALLSAGSTPGGGGSGGSPGSGNTGGSYGGGGSQNGTGGNGAVRVIWGVGRSFPSTNVGLNFGGVTETTV